MTKNDIIKLNHSLKYNNYEEEHDEDGYSLYNPLEDYCYRGCTVCEEDYLLPEWEPMKLEDGSYIEYVYCCNCYSRIEHFGGKVLYDGVNKVWYVDYLKKR